MRKVGILDVLVPALLLAIVVLGAWLRVQDPGSTSVIGAEDPYTHLVLTKEALARGYFGDSQWLGNTMYPPGIHALGGALASDSGTDLYAWTLWAPLAFGVLAIVGTYVLAARLGGPVAGLVSALVVALMPEHVFRSELYFPTALDLAILPAWMLSFVLANAAESRPAQRYGGIALFALLTPALAFAHPWAVPLFLMPLAVWLALRVVRSGQPYALALRRLAQGAAMAVVGVAFAFASRWDHTESGFASFLDHLGPLALLSRLSFPPLVLFVAFTLILGALAVPLVWLGALVSHARPRVHRAFRFALAAVAAIALLAAIPAISGHLPPDVNYRNMLGPLAITLALAGIVVALLRPTSLGDLALAISVPLFPLTAIDVFHSPFWPQRTVVYLGLGVALLGGAAVAGLHDTVVSWTARRAPARKAWIAPAIFVATALLVAGAAYAQPAKDYTWYRLYSEDELHGIDQTVSMLNHDPSAAVIVESWQPGLFLKARGADPNQVKYCPKCFSDAGARSKQIGSLHGPILVVGDKYLDKDAARGKADAGWVSGSPIVVQAGAWRVWQERG